MASFLGKNKKLDKAIQSDFKTTNKLNRYIWFDEKNKMISISVKDQARPTYIFEYKNFKGYSIISSEKEVKSKSGVGRAVGGGLLFGPTGAIVGAITGKEDGKTLINNLYLKIELEYNGVPAYETIPFILFKKVDTNSKKFKEIENDLKDIINALDKLLDS